MRVCETCKHRSTPSPELLEVFREICRLYPKVYYCKLLQVIKVYDPSSPAKMFNCELFEQE